jgi:hypothetical protein
MIERSAFARRVAPGLAVVVLVVAVFLGGAGGAGLGAADPGPAAGFAAALDGLERDNLVLVGFDPDVGTYAEVRPTVRSALADVLRRGFRLAVVSLTPEGRALAALELARLASLGADMRRVTDLGFRPGSEAALVAIARSAAGEGTDAIAGVPAFAPDPPALVLVVGGNDLGPRSWVEQVAPRTEQLPIVAITPTVLLPEVRPYLASGQLAGLLGTPGDGAAYRASLRLGTSAPMAELDGPPPAALLVGLLVAAGAIGLALSRRILASLGRSTGEAA